MLFRSHLDRLGRRGPAGKCRREQVDHLRGLTHQRLPAPPSVRRLQAPDQPRDDDQGGCSQDQAEPAAKKLTPFATAGIGLLSAEAANGGVFLKPSGTGTRNVLLLDGARFFTLNYGGGVQATRLAGPVGLRFDVRGRTAPNMLASSTTFFEFSGGVTFNFVFPD